MPHIDLPEAPGILAPMKAYPRTANAMQQLAEEVLRGPSPLSPAERELIAAYSSSRNDCSFCVRAHSAVAWELLDEKGLVREILDDPESAPIDERMKALLAIAGTVQDNPRVVTKEEIDRARGAGATDEAIHDTVAVAATFAMFNRYVDGLGTWAPEDDTTYRRLGRGLATRGYTAKDRDAAGQDAAEQDAAQGMTLAQSFDWAVARHPDRVAVKTPGDRRPLTYAQLQHLTERLAGGFTQQGIGPDDRVMIFAPNGPEVIVTLLTGYRTGRLIVPVNARAAAGDLAYYASDAEAGVLVYHASLAETVASVRDELDVQAFVQIGGDPPSWAIGFDELLACDPPSQTCDTSPSTLATIAYTGGTTGRPKGIPIDHQRRLFRALSFIYRGTIQERDTVGLVLPLYHALGLTVLAASLQAGGTIVLLSPSDPEGILEAIERESINTFQAVPTILHALLECEAIDTYDLSSLREVTTAGQIATQKLFDGVTEKLCEGFRNIYGTTETMHICYTRSPSPSVGRPASFQEVRLVDPNAEGPAEAVDKGAIGEVITRMDGPEVFDGYWKRPAETGESVRGGWFFTGDLAYEDEEGRFWLVGRKDDMIISGGENIAPSEVEDVLLRYPGVREVAVVGAPSERWGEKVVAFVAGEDVSGEALDRFCLEADFADYKRPRTYHFVDEIPKTPVGKIDRTALKERDAGRESS